MADITVTPQKLSANGVTPTPVPNLLVADVYLIRNSERTVLEVATGATPVNVTLQTPGNVAGNAVADKVVAVPANSRRFFSSIKARAYNDIRHILRVQFSAITNVNFFVYEP